MAPPRGLVEDANALLARMYSTGERCDLLIRCSKKGTKHYHEFKVHKCIVYPAIPVLEQLEVKNRNFTIINLAESANVVDAMLRHLYKVPIGCVPEEVDTEDQLRAKADLESVQLAIELRKAAAEIQFNVPSLLPLTELIIGNSLHRVVHRTFEPEHLHTPSKVREAEKKLPQEVRHRRREERKAAEVQAAVDRPLVDFVKIVLSLENKRDDDEYRPLRVAALFVLATRMPRILNCDAAYDTLRTGGDDFYETATTMAYQWLELTERGESDDDRGIAAQRLFKVCAEYVGIEWKAEFLEQWMVFEPAKWGEERDPWRRAMREDEE